LSRLNAVTVDQCFSTFFAPAEPHTSVKVTHGTPCTLIRESSNSFP